MKRIIVFISFYCLIITCQISTYCEHIKSIQGEVCAIQGENEQHKTRKTFNDPQKACQNEYTLYIIEGKCEQYDKKFVCNPDPSPNNIVTKLDDCTMDNIDKCKKGIKIVDDSCIKI